MVRPTSGFASGCRGLRRSQARCCASEIPRRVQDLTMNELERDEFGVVLHHPEAGILELQWLEGSAGMTDGDFMASMQRYSAHAEQHETPYLLVDVTRFK